MLSPTFSFAAAAAAVAFIRPWAYWTVANKSPVGIRLFRISVDRWLMCVYTGHVGFPWKQSAKTTTYYCITRHNRLYIYYIPIGVLYYIITPYNKILLLTIIIIIFIQLQPLEFSEYPLAIPSQNSGCVLHIIMSICDDDCRANRVVSPPPLSTPLFNSGLDKIRTHTARHIKNITMSSLARYCLWQYMVYALS